jgi:hypothetical protein
MNIEKDSGRKIKDEEWNINTVDVHIVDENATKPELN